MRGKIIAIDFDGVIADYSQGWQGRAVFGDIVPGTIEALEKLEREGWQIIIYTARPEYEEVREYLIEHAIPFSYVTKSKPHVRIYIDDRAIRFNGCWEDILPQLDDFEPWYHRDK